LSTGKRLKKGGKASFSPGPVKRKFVKKKGCYWGGFVIKGIKRDERSPLSIEENNVERSKMGEE